MKRALKNIIKRAFGLKLMKHNITIYMIVALMKNVDYSLVGIRRKTVI